jgi:hypothetical protein
MYDAVWSQITQNCESYKAKCKGKNKETLKGGLWGRHMHYFTWFVETRRIKSIIGRYILTESFERTSSGIKLQSCVSFWRSCSLVQSQFPIFIIMSLIQFLPLFSHALFYLINYYILISTLNSVFLIPFHLIPSTLVLNITFSFFNSVLISTLNSVFI